MLRSMVNVKSLAEKFVQQKFFATQDGRMDSGRLEDTTEYIDPYAFQLDKNR